MNQLILVVDVQKQYITEGNPFHIRGISHSLENGKKILAAARTHNIPVWHMRHKKENENLPHTEFILGFEPAQNEFSFTKQQYSCFSSKELTDKLAQVKPKEIIIIGYGSGMCCLCTIIDGIHRGYQFALVEDASASRDSGYAGEETMHISAINILKQYARIVKTNELISTMTTEKIYEAQ